MSVVKTDHLTCTHCKSLGNVSICIYAEEWFVDLEDETMDQRNFGELVTHFRLSDILLKESDRQTERETDRTQFYVPPLD